MKLIRNILLGIGVVLMTLFYTLVSVVQTPARLLRYRKSPFARETGAAYEAGITDCRVYRLFNALREQGIPIDVIAHPKHPADAHLRWRDTLIIHEIDSIGRKDGTWVIGSGSPVWKAGLELKEAIAEVLDDAFDDCPGCELDDAVILADRAAFTPEDLAPAAAFRLFLLYSDEEECLRVLRDYCASH